MTAPTDNLCRAYVAADALELRGDTEGDGNTLFGHFAVFDQWTEINSYFEGQFMERLAPGAFKDTIRAKGDRVRVLYDHGADPSIGNKPLGTIRSLKEDSTGVAYEVGLFDASYVNDLKPAIRAGALGASFRFKVTSEEWADPTRATKINPSKLPERTITGVDLYEFGPVTFPAYAEATAGMRSDTDRFYDRLLHDPIFLARMTERLGARIVEQMIEEAPADGRAETPEESDDVDLTVPHRDPRVLQMRAALQRLR